MGKLTVYKQLTSSPNDLFQVLRQEIGLKTACVPFAVKAIKALQSLGRLTESEALSAANVFLDNLQTLNQGGIVAEDYDKIDFVKRGKSITISARVEAFLRAAARKGYRITETIVAVPEEDSNTTYFKEHFHNGEIVYILEDRRFQGDRAVTADRIVSNYFSKFICRLEVTEVGSNKRIAMTNCEMSNEEMLNISGTSEQGLYKTRWENYTKPNGYQGKRKVVTDELNKNTFWALWTSEMVNKTIIRRALKRIREVLPELKETIYAFDNDVIDVQPQEEQLLLEIPVETEDVNLEKLTEQQKADVKETLDLFRANPKLASDQTDEIKRRLEGGESLQSVINTHFASIMNIKRSKKLYPIIRPFFEAGAPPAPATDSAPQKKGDENAGETP